MPEAGGFEHFTVETPGLRTHVAALGAGEPLVLLHGFPQHWWQWRTIAPLLAGRYRVICPDLRGAGWTEADTVDVHRQTRLHDLVAVLDTLGLDQIRVVCHDMGVVTGMQLAYGHPERVRAMAQLSVPPAFMSFSPKVVPAFAHMPRLLMHRPGQSVRWLFSPRYMAKPMTSATIDAYLVAQQRPEVDLAIGKLYRGMVVPEAIRLVGGSYRRQRLQPPTLVVFGRRDEPFTEPVVRQVSGDTTSYATHVEFSFIEDASHFLTDDAPEAVAQVLLDWFERIE